MSNTIDYQSKFKPPSEYEHAYEKERGHWLRRRLLWYSGTSLVISLLSSVPALIVKGEEITTSDVVAIIFSNAAAALVLILAWRCRPAARSVLKIAFVFYVLSSLLTIGYSYISFVHESGQLQSGLNKGFAAGRDKRNADEASSTQAGTRPASKPAFIEGDLGRADEPLTVNLGWTKLNTNGNSLRENIAHLGLYSILLTSFAFNHLTICIFIPWTIRESIRPAIIIAAAASGMALINVVFGFAAWWLLLAMVLLLPFAFIPGTLVCWWRYSQFNKNFRMQFESGRYRLLQHELNSAREVHDANLPAPRLDGPIRMSFDYEPMRQIGGDLLMVHPNDPALPIRYVILFDVTGHGVAAALSVNRIVGEIERLLAENPDESVESLTRSLNRYIHLTLARHHLYVSALIFKLDHAAGVMSCVNAGHPTAYHADGQSKSIRAIESTSMLLGVVPNDLFDVESVNLPFVPGDALIGYTDGASEATNHDGQMLGLAGVREMIARTVGSTQNPGDWPSLVSQSIVQHRLAPPQDDTIIFTVWGA